VKKDDEEFEGQEWNERDERRQCRRQEAAAPLDLLLPVVHAKFSRSPEFKSSVQ
jgi:hypothetical protein